MNGARGGGAPGPRSRCPRDGLAAAAHDLRTPLLAIRMGCDLLAAGAAGRDPEAAGLVQEVRRAGLELGGMVERALWLARLDAGLVEPAFAPLDLGRAVRAAVEAAGPPAANRSVRIELAIPPDLPAAHGDPALLGRILTELLDNALAFSPAGQEVAVTAGEAPGSPRPLRLRVADRGPGVPRAEAAAIFAPWVRASSGARGRTRGLGLGLAVARGLAHLLGGRLRLLPGGPPGAVFELALAAAPQAPGSAAL